MSKDTPDHHDAELVLRVYELRDGAARHRPSDYFMESSGEGLFLYVRVAPYQAQYREEVSPVAFRNSEWVATETATGRRMFDVFTTRVKAKLESR